MLNKPTVAELMAQGNNRYTLVIATAKRARQLYSGSLPLTKENDPAPVTQAAEEIDGDLLKIYNKDEFKSDDIVNPLIALEAKKAKEDLEKAKLELQDANNIKTRKTKAKLYRYQSESRNTDIESDDQV